jgi:hypothetical protein
LAAVVEATEFTKFHKIEAFSPSSTTARKANNNKKTICVESHALMEETEPFPGGPPTPLLNESKGRTKPKWSLDYLPKLNEY